jgi:tripartite-type tricarboxylate transporter receptor subunit TctC
VLPQIQSGDLKALAISSPARNMALPNLQTLREQGVADADAESWAAFFAPAATPAPALERLSAAIIAALDSNSAREAILRTGFTMKTRNPAEFRPYHAQELTALRDVITAAGIKPVE